MLIIIRAQLPITDPYFCQNASLISGKEKAHKHKPFCPGTAWSEKHYCMLLLFKAPFLWSVQSESFVLEIERLGFRSSSGSYRTCSPASHKASSSKEFMLQGSEFLALSSLMGTLALAAAHRRPGDKAFTKIVPWGLLPLKSMSANRPLLFC